MSALEFCAGSGLKSISLHTCPSPFAFSSSISACFLRRSLKKIKVNGMAKKKAKISFLTSKTAPLILNPGF